MEGSAKTVLGCGGTFLEPQPLGGGASLGYPGSLRPAWVTESAALSESSPLTPGLWQASASWRLPGVPPTSQGKQPHALSCLSLAAVFLSESGHSQLSAPRWEKTNCSGFLRLASVTAHPPFWDLFSSSFSGSLGEGWAFCFRLLIKIL